MPKRHHLSAKAGLFAAALAVTVPGTAFAFVGAPGTDVHTGPSFTRVQSCASKCAAKYQQYRQSCIDQCNRHQRY